MSKHAATMLSETTGVSSDMEKVIEKSGADNDKVFFDQKSQMQGCHVEMNEHKINIATCVDAREYCDAVMARYTVLLDNATQMPSEHIQKEKEYGIMWRSAFKKEMNELIGALYQQVVASDGFDEKNMDPFNVLHQIVKKDCIDAATFDMKTQADLLCMMVENLDILEKVVGQVKVMLKEPMPEGFKEKRDEILAKIVRDQAAFADMKGQAVEA